MGCVLWFTLPFGPNIWRVYLGYPDECPQLDGHEGVTVHRECVIYIDRTLEPSRIVGVLGHELIHAALTNLNLEASAALYGCEESEEATRKAEERVAVAIGANLIDALQRAGLLKLPKLPND